MKKLYTVLACLFTGSIAFAQNSFPAQGDVVIRTQDLGSKLIFVDENHAIYGRKNYQGIADALSFYEYGNIDFYTGGPIASQGHRLRIGSNGNLGIGTTNPQTRLEVAAPSYSFGAAGTLHLTGGQAWGHVLTLATDAASGDDARLLFSYRNKSKQWALGGQSNTNRFSIWEDSGDGTYGSNWGSERFTVLSGGNVGIGTSSPQGKLDVRGPMLTGSGSSNLDNVSLNFLANSGQMLIGWNKSAYAGEAAFISNQGGAIGTAVGGFAFYNHNDSNQENRLMWIRGDGNVIMGTESAHAKLDVNGNIHTREIKVDTENYPDYVFKSSYHLRSLEEVKTYIDKHHHLPEMPSEREVIANGINLGEIVKLQTKKIEELTLYLIKQQKELKALKKLVKHRSK